MVSEGQVTEHRAYEIRLEEDPNRGGPGILMGTLMPYETRASDRPEMFAGGALHWDEGGVVLREQHNRQAPITRFVPEVRANEVHVEIPLPDTQRGRDAAVMVRDGTLTGLSVEFRTELETRRGGLRVVQRAKLVGAGLVDSPSYPGTNVEVREHRGRRRWWR